MSQMGIRCSACKKRITDQEPDLVVRRLEGGCRRHYHTRCGAAAYAQVAKAPAVWVMTVRHAEETAN